MEPLALILDQLQGDQRSYNGMLVPKLTQLRHKLSVLAADNLIYCNPLANALLVGLNSRCSVMFSLDLTEPEAKDAIMAAMSHPQYNLKWVLPNKRDEVTSAFVDVVVRANKLSSVQTVDAAETENEQDN